jgi:hypothetical protein
VAGFLLCTSTASLTRCVWRVTLQEAKRERKNRPFVDITQIANDPLHEDPRVNEWRAKHEITCAGRVRRLAFSLRALLSLVFFSSLFHFHNVATC